MHAHIHVYSTQGTQTHTQHNAYTYIYTQYTLHLDMTRDIVVLSTETWDDQQTRDLQYEP